MQKRSGHRHSIRLPGFDYAQAGGFFVTICTYARQPLFGDVVDGQMRLNSLGRIVEDEWRQSQALRQEIVLDAFVVMPNHAHAIVLSRGRQAVGAHGVRPLGRAPGSLGSLVAGFKAAVTRRINATRGMPDTLVWQGNYWERIIRHDQSLDRIRHYIATNPARWPADREHPEQERPDAASRR